MTNYLPDEIPTGFAVVSKWSSHWLLCRLMQGSDLDGDWAFFWIEQGDVSPADLRRIVFQEREPGGDWTECPSAEDAFFPAINSSQASVAGAYPHLGRSKPAAIEYRALVPHDLMGNFGYKSNS